MTDFNKGEIWVVLPFRQGQNCCPNKAFMWLHEQCLITHHNCVHASVVNTFCLNCDPFPTSGRSVVGAPTMDLLESCQIDSHTLLNVTHVLHEVCMLSRWDEAASSAVGACKKCSLHVQHTALTHSTVHSQWDSGC